jgi:hypothetical protein
VHELYDLSKELRETRDFRFVCGRIVHSFAFFAGVRRTGGRRHPVQLGR